MLLSFFDDHHPPLDFTCNLDHLFIDKSSNDLLFYNFIKCDFSRLSNIGFNQSLSIDLTVNKFYDIINHLIELFVPKCRVFNYQNHAECNLELRRLVNLK